MTLHVCLCPRAAISSAMFMISIIEVWRGISRTKVPTPVRRDRYPSLVSSRIARLTVMREMPKSSTIWFSDGMRYAGGPVAGGDALEDVILYALIERLRGRVLCKGFRHAALPTPATATPAL